MKKTILFAVAITFLMSSVCFGAKVDPAKIIVPHDSGRIVETYVAPNADAPVIAYVQDIHVNYEAQKAEAVIMEALIRDYGFDLVLLEALRQDHTLDFKRWKSETQEVRQAAAEDLLKEGTFKGVEYLGFISDKDFTVQGIEDMPLYKSETEDQMIIFDKSPDMTKLVSTLQNIASNLKLHIYTKEMRDLDNKIAAYDKDEIGLVEYMKFVQGAATANNIDVKAFSNVALFIESADMEGQINFPAVETERATAVEAIEKGLNEKAKEEFTARNLKFRTGNISQGEFYAYLKDAAQSAKVDLNPHKNLNLYTQYITTYEKIDTGLLFKELDSLVDKIREAMIKTPEQKRLSEIDKGLSIISGFVNTKLVPDEYNFYVQNKTNFDLDGWLKFLKDNSVKFTLTNPVPDDVSVLKTNLPVLERFYAISFDRDQAFIKNIGANLTKYGKDKAILITGGFHTVNMKKLLKEKGYSYVVIAPRVDVIKDYSALYREKSKLALDYANNAIAATQASLHGGSNKDAPPALDTPAGQAQAQAKVEEKKKQGPAAPLAQEPGAADKDDGTGHISRDYKIKDGVVPRFDTDVNTGEPVVIFTMQHINPDTGRVIGEEEAVIRYSETTIDTAALAKELTDAGVPAELQKALLNLANNAGRVIRLEDNRWGLIGFTQPGLMGFAQSMDGLNVSRLHELVERGLRTPAGQPGHIPLTAIVPAGQGGVVEVAPGVTFADYVSDHGDTNEARLHAASRAFTFNNFRAQDEALTRTIRLAMQTFAGKHPVRNFLDEQFAKTEQKTKITLVVPIGTSRENINNWDSVRAISDVAEVSVEYATSAQDMVNKVAVPAGEIALAVANGEMADQVPGLSENDRKVLAGTALIQVENLNLKAEGKSLRDIALGVLLQLHQASQIEGLTAAHPIVQALAVELSQIRGRAEEITGEEALQLVPLRDDLPALAARIQLLAQIRLLPAAIPQDWQERYQEMLAVRSVIIAA